MNDKPLEQSLQRLSQLSKLVVEDLKNQPGINCERHRKEFNKLVTEISKCDGFEDIVALPPVPHNLRGADHSPSAAEVEKLREVSVQSELLKSRLESVLEKSAVTSLKNQKQSIQQELPKRIWIPALCFASALLVFFMFVFFKVPNMTDSQKGIFALLFPPFCGFSAFFMGGTALFALDFPQHKLGKMAFSATAGIAVFAFTWVKAPYWFQVGAGHGIVQAQKDEAIAQLREIEKHPFFADTKFQLSVAVAEGSVTDLCGLIKKRLQAGGTDEVTNIDRSIVASKAALSTSTDLLPEMKRLIDLISTEHTVLMQLTKHPDLRATTAQCVKLSDERLLALKSLLQLIAKWVETPVESDYKQVPDKIEKLRLKANPQSESPGFHSIITELDDCLAGI